MENCNTCDKDEDPKHIIIRPLKEKKIEPNSIIFDVRSSLILFNRMQLTMNNMRIKIGRILPTVSGIPLTFIPHFGNVRLKKIVRYRR